MAGTKIDWCHEIEAGTGKISLQKKNVKCNMVCQLDLNKWGKKRTGTQAQTFLFFI